jgi:DNA modification methylase
VMMRPTDEWEGVRLHCADGLTVLASLADASVDCIVTDPPYCSGGVSEASRTQAPGQGLRSENVRRFGWFTGDNMTTAGLLFLIREVAFESCRVVKPSGSLVVFCDWRMVPTLAPAIESAGLRYQNEIVWNKGSLGLGTGFRGQQEKALHFTYGSPEYHAADVGNVITLPRIGKDREHQTQKPTKLLRDIIRVVCPPGGTVFDPFAGSGSTGVAALAEGRRAILVERDPGHYATALKRLRQADGVGSLFERGNTQLTIGEE